MYHSSRTPVAGWALSRHSRLRAIERGISEAQIRDVLCDPDVTYTQSNYGPNRQVLQGGDLGVVVDWSSHTVITVLFRDQQRWRRQQNPSAVTA